MLELGPQLEVAVPASLGGRGRGAKEPPASAEPREKPLTPQQQFAVKQLERTIKNIHRLAGEGREALLRWTLWTHELDLPVTHSLMFYGANEVDFAWWAASGAGQLVAWSAAAMVCYYQVPWLGWVVGPAGPLVVSYDRWRAWQKDALARAVTQYRKRRYRRAEAALERLLVSRHPTIDIADVYPYLISLAWRRREAYLALARVERLIQALDASESETERFDAVATRVWLQIETHDLDAAREGLGCLLPPKEPTLRDRLVQLELPLRLARKARTQPPADTVSALDELVSEFLELPDDLTVLSVSMALLGWAFESQGDAARAARWRHCLEQRGNRDALRTWLPG